MRDDMMNPFPPSPSPAPAESPSPDGQAPPAPQADAVVVAPSVLKFKACRWRCDPDDGEFCTHRDVLPFAGKNDFKADSWCPECAFYKLRRTPKKRDWAAERANNY